jgi:hypothetical protein
VEPELDPEVPDEVVEVLAFVLPIVPALELEEVVELLDVAVTHWWLAASHVSPGEQSDATLQPPVGSHVPSTLHVAERQTRAPPSAIVHGPSPVA